MTWPLVPLGSVADVQLGKMLSPKAKAGTIAFPYLRNVNVQWGHIELSDLLDMNFDEREQEKFSLLKGDLVVCEGGEPGRCAVVDRDLNGVYFQKALMRVRPRNGSIDTRFLQRFIAFAAQRGVFSKGGNQSTIAHFPAVKLNALRVPAPSLEEQRRIADILDKADAIRRKRKEAIALAEELLRSAFLEMFGDPVTNPKGWPVKPLGALAANIDYGVTASASAQRVGPKFLRITDIQDNRVNWDLVPFCECDSATAKRARLAPGDIVFARTGATTGKSFWIRACPDDAVFASYLIRVRPGTSVLPAYLSEFFQSGGYWAQVRSMAEGAAQPGVNATKLASLRVPVPPTRVQYGMADVAARVAQLQHQAERGAIEADTLFDSLVARAFSGILRA